MPQLGEIARDRKSNQCVWLACEQCGKERWVRLENGQPRCKVCTSCRGRQLGLKYGQDNPNWRHGNSYVHVRWPIHPKAILNFGRVSRARLMLEMKLGRPIKDGMHIHHINGIRTDDRLENLIELTPSEHMKLHHPKRKGG